MEQHAIPQNVSSYQFKLVGDMTLKQFFQVAGGVLAGLFFYSLPIIGIVKWPFAIVSVILGIALAFMPLEERPLERWIFAFFRAIYSPTIFNWRKTSVPTKFFQDEPANVPSDVTPQQEAALQQYMGVNAQKGGPLDKLEGAEKGFMSYLSGIFSGLSAQTTNVTQQTTQPMPQPQGQVQTTPQAPTELKIPETESVRFVSEQKQRAVVEEKPATNTVTTNQVVAPVIAGNEFISTRQAQFSVDAAPPSPPTIANVAVGQIVDQDRKIVDGAILEIKDAYGRPVRALRSNKLGHFVIVTPLENGKYELSIEKDGFDFSPVTFEANGAIIPPILIKGTKISPGLSSQGPNNSSQVVLNQNYAN